MAELIKEILSKIGIPGAIVSIILIGIKIKPITLFSSSTIEMKLSTKDKRFYIRTIRIFFEIVFYTLFLLLITIQFFTDKNIYSPSIALIATVISVGIFIWILVLDFRGKTYFDLVENFQVKWKVTFFVLFVIHFISYFFIVSYYFGTQLFSKFYNESLTINERYGALFAVVILYFAMIVSIYFTVIKCSYRFLGFSKNLYNNLTIIIKDETWYIFHPVENDLFLLGNKSIISECTKIKFIEKKELLKEQIEIKKDSE